MATDADTNTTDTGTESAGTGANTGTDTNAGNDNGAGAGTHGTLLTDKPGEAANGNQDAGNADAKDGNAEAGKKGAETAAYTLTAPEGYPISEGALKGLNEVCQTANLNEEQANAVMAYMQSNYTSFVAHQQEAMQAQAKTWIGEFQADKEAAQCKDEINETLRQHTAATERRLGITGGVASRSGLTASPARQVILQIA